MTDYLGLILERKRREVARRYAHVALAANALGTQVEDRGSSAVARLRRNGAPLARVIAEIKVRSPSAGEIRRREPAALQAIGAGYERAGAAAVSVLCDRVGFGGSVLDLRRVRAEVRVPVLFKEFVQDAIQVRLARALGADLVLLIVRALPERDLRALCDEIVRHGMAPVVEAADEDEVAVAARTSAQVIGVNARDLRTFQVDPERARRALERIPHDRVAVHMSGIASAEALLRISRSPADAVLVGEALMRAPDPGERLRGWLAEASAAIANGA